MVPNDFFLLVFTSYVTPPHPQLECGLDLMNTDKVMGSLFFSLYLEKRSPKTLTSALLARFSFSPFLTHFLES